MIRLSNLERLDACAEARRAFQERFPDGANYRELILALADHPYGLAWWEWLAPKVSALAPAWEQYWTVREPIDEQYRTARKPVYEQYRTVMLPIKEQYQTAMKPLYEQWTDKKLDYEQYLAARKPIHEQYLATRKPIFGQLCAALESINEQNKIARKPTLVAVAELAPA